MSRYIQSFIRKEELALTYQTLKESSQRCLIIHGHSGSGKTTLLRALYELCLNDSQIFPIYCSCLSKETVACSIARIERALAMRVLRAKGLRGEFSAFLLNRIRRELRITTWNGSRATDLPLDKEELFQVSLLERIIDPKVNLSYRIGEREAKQDFFSTVRNVIDLLGSDRPLGLIVDCDRSNSPEFLNVLASAKSEFANNLKLVATLDAAGGESFHESAWKDSFMLFPIVPWTREQVQQLVFEVEPTALDSFAIQLWERSRGHPFIVDSLLQRIDRIPLNSLADASVPEQVKDISAKLYSSIEDLPTRQVVEALAVLYDGGNPNLVANLSGVSLEGVLKISQDVNLITTLSAPDDKTDVQLDLFHPAFKEQVELLMPSDSRAKMRRSAGLYYLSSIDRIGSIVSPGTALATPHYFVNSDKDLFADVMVLTLPLALLLGDLETTKGFVSSALNTSRKRDIVKESTLLNGMSVLSFEEGDLNKATTYCLAALAIARQRGKPSLLEMTVLSNLAFLLQLQEKLSEALRYAQEAMAVSHQLSLESGFQRSLPANLSNIGLIYEKLGDLKNALKYYEQAFREDQRHQNTVGEASDLRKIGAVLVDLGEYEKAIESHSQALKLDEQMENRYGVASDFGNLGVAHYFKGDPKQSLFWLEKAHASFSEFGATNEAMQVLQLINEISCGSVTGIATQK